MTDEGQIKIWEVVMTALVANRQSHSKCQDPVYEYATYPPKPLSSVR